MTVYITEQQTSLFRWSLSQLGSQTVTIIGSEYRDANVESSVELGIRHEDAEQLTLPDESVDLYVSCDVFEHLSDPYSALREMSRVLRPRGQAILTFPMDPHLASTIRRARRHGATVEHLLPAIYHRDPARPGGALVFNEFGWDILEEIRKAGLFDVGLYVYWSYLCGYLGIQFFFIAYRAAAV
jgi:SAM-dependent methyltransferase